MVLTWAGLGEDKIRPQRRAREKMNRKKGVRT